MKLAQREWGTGPRTLAIVHGINGSAALWQWFAEQLVDRFDFHVVAVDLRGHGASARASGYRLDDFAADVVESLPAGLDVILGHSLGGRIVERALPALSPGRAIYLDPGFAIAVPSFVRNAPGLQGFLSRMLAISAPGVPVVARPLKRQTTADWDRRMSRQIVLDLAENHVAVAAPLVPSTVLLSHRSPLVPARYAARLREVGWDIRAFPRAKHDMYLLDATGTIDRLEDVLSAG
jgi:pimeloyl-ACP methyl ester carboxylesterase